MCHLSLSCLLTSYFYLSLSLFIWCRLAAAPTVCASTSDLTSRARWWSSATTASRCRTASAAAISTPATLWMATGPCTSTPTTGGASTSCSLASIADSVTGVLPVPPLAPSEESLIFKQEELPQVGERGRRGERCMIVINKSYTLQIKPRVSIFVYSGLPV